MIWSKADADRAKIQELHDGTAMIICRPEDLKTLRKEFGPRVEIHASAFVNPGDCWIMDKPAPLVERVREDLRVWAMDCPVYWPRFFFPVHLI